MKTKHTFRAMALAFLLLAPAYAVHAGSVTTSYGGTTVVTNSYAEVYSIAVDKNDNVYYAGIFSDDSTNFNPVGSDLLDASDGEMFLSKQNADGSYGWTINIGGTNSHTITPQDMVIDNSGNIYVAGEFRGTNVNFNPSGSDLFTSNGIQYDAFVAKYNSSGNLIWVRTVGGTNIDLFRSIALGSNGNLYVAGEFTETVDLDPTAGTDSYVKSCGVHGGDLFVSRYDTDGSYVWSKVFSTDDTSIGYLSLDSSDNIYISGYFYGSIDLDPGTATDNHTSDGYDSLVVKLDQNGNYVWGVQSGGSGNQNFGANVSTSDGTYVEDDDLLRKYSSTGSLSWSKSTGGSTVNPQVITADSKGDVYIAGQFEGTNVNLNPDGSDLFSNDSGDYDLFISKWMADGTYAWSEATNNGIDIWPNDISVSSDFSVYTGGYLLSDVGGTNFNRDGSDVLGTGDGFSFDTFLTRWDQTFYNEITNLPSNIELKDESGNPISPDSFESGQIVIVQLVDNSSSAPIVSVPLNLTVDVDWSSITLGTDLSSGKAFVSGLSAATGSSGNHTLYIPKLEAQQSVFICPDATSLAEVSESCPNAQQYSETDSNVSIETINGQQYWVVSGLSGTGGVGSVLAVRKLSETGSPVIVQMIIGVSLVFIPIFISAKGPYRLNCK